VRPVVVKKNGQTLFADHVRRGYRYLLSFDKANRREYYLIAAQGLLRRKFGVSMGTAICIALVKAKFLTPIGFIDGVYAKKWRIRRVDNIGSLGYGLQKLRPHTKKRRSTPRTPKPCPKGVSASDALNPLFNQCRELPHGIIRQLLKSSGRSPKRLPKHVHVAFEF